MFVLATLGFDEKFIIRDLFARGIEENTKLVLLSSGKDNRTLVAYENIRKLAEIAGFKVEMITLDLKDHVNSISKIKEIIRENIGQEKIVFNLSGGQRLLIFYVILAIISLEVYGELVIHSEAGDFTLNLPTNVLFRHPLDEEEYAILKFLKKNGRANLNTISDELGIPKVTAWRKINKLLKLELIKKKEREYYLTELGEIRI